MSHPIYGEKYSCFECGTKFYNMNKPKPLCPKCGANQRKAPKKPLKKPAKQMLEGDFDSDTEASGELGEETFPVTEGEEGFKADEERLIVDSVPDEDY